MTSSKYVIDGVNLEPAMEAAEKVIATSPRKAVYEMAWDLAEAAVRGAFPEIRDAINAQFVGGAYLTEEEAQRFGEIVQRIDDAGSATGLSPAEVQFLHMRSSQIDRLAALTKAQP